MTPTLESVDWVSVYGTNWFPLSPDQVKAWDDQVQLAVSGLRRGEMAAAILYFAGLPAENKADKAGPKPRQIIDFILSRRRAEAQAAPRQEEYFGPELDNAVAIARTGDWYKLDEYLWSLSEKHHFHRTLFNVLEPRLSRQFPAWNKQIWCDARADAYEVLLEKPCPYRQPGRET